MTAWICATCGNQHADTVQPPAVCAICDDERQWVPAGGQRWTSLAELAREGHRGVVRQLEPNLLGVGVEPAFAIGQRGLVVRTASGNLLWDVPGFIDDATVAAVEERGGPAVITASHPHFYGVMAEWADAFGDATILLPESDRHWVRRDHPAIQNWNDRLEVLPGITLIQCGGHFEGSAVAHWAAGADGDGALLVGDTLTVTPGQDRVSFMRSYPNLIPLPERAVRGVVETISAYPYRRIYGGWWDRVIEHQAPEAVRHSADRYLAWLHDQATDVG